MNMTGWQHLGAEAVSLFVREPPEIQLVTMLAMAFAALMILEGLCASFMPRRAAAKTIQEPHTSAAIAETRATPPQAGAAQPPFERNKFGATQHFYASAHTTIIPKRKPPHSIVRMHRVMRPAIRRATVFPVTEL